MNKSPLSNIYIRLILGSIQIFIGLILLKLYSQKNKDNIWGQIYRHIYHLKLDFAKMTGVKDPKTLKSFEKIWLFLAIFAISVGFIIIILGYRY